MPRKRNRDDEQEQKQQGPSTTEVVLVKTDSSQSEAPNGIISSSSTLHQVDELDRKDKEELKKWVKELLKENLEVKKEKDELNEQHAKANIVHKLHTLFNTVFELPRRKAEYPVFYPNPYLVEEVVNHKIDDSFFLPRSTIEQRVQCKFSKHVASFSEIVSAFKDVDGFDFRNLRSAYLDEFLPLSDPPRFYLHVVDYNDRYLVVGATAPYNYKFSKEIRSWDVYQKVQSKYSHTDLRLNFDLPTVFGGAVFLYPDPKSDHPKSLEFDKEDDVVNFLLSSAPSYDSKVKGYLPKAPNKEAEAVEVVFDLDTMTVKGKRLSERGFHFDYHGFDEDDDEDEEEDDDNDE